MKRRFSVASLACGLLVACAPAPSDAPRAAESDGKSHPPDFELRSLSGESLRLSDHLGKQVILLDFWATFCEPCLRAMPALDGLYRKYREQGLLVLGVAIDGADSLPEVRADAQKLGVTFPILLDQETRVVALYNPKTSAPFSVLIGRDGRIVAKKEGYSTGSHEALEQDIVRALKP